MQSEFQISDYLNNSAFVLKTQQQIAKDFAKLNLFFPEYFESTVQDKEEIEVLISDQLVEILKEGETRLLQLLYTIDIPEKQFLTITSSANFIRELSAKILFREAYKVFLREKFST